MTSDRPSSPPRAQRGEVDNRDLSETGLKVIDLLAPLAQRGKAAMFAGAGVGRIVLVKKLIHALVEK